MREATRTVFRVLAKHVTPGEIAKIASSLPSEIRALWPAAGAPAEAPGEKAPAAT